VPTVRARPDRRVVVQSFELSEDQVTAKILEVIPLASEGTVDIASADIIVSGGRGMYAPGKLSLVGGVGQALGGVVAASRGAVAAGWMPQGGKWGRRARP